MSTKPRVVILARVSTKKQETDRQEQQLLEVAKTKGWNVVKVIRETVSGTAQEADREGIAIIRKMMEEKQIDKVMVHEVSRLSRRPTVAHNLVDEMTDQGVSLYWHAHQMETLTERGTRNTMTGVMLALLLEFGRAEVETTRERIYSGLEEARRKGVVLGRRHGSSIAPEVFLERNKDAVAVVKKYPGMSLRELSKLTDLSTGTVNKIRTLLAD